MGTDVPTTATINTQYPGSTPAGTTVEIVGAVRGSNGSSVFVQIGRRTVKVATKWLDIEPERCPTCGRVLEEGEHYE